MSRFVPVRLPHLVERLAEDFFLEPAQRRSFLDLARLAGDLERHSAGARLRVQEELYAPYDPDDDTVPAASVAPHSDRERTARLFEWIGAAFGQANFETIGDEALEASLRASEWSTPRGTADGRHVIRRIEPGGRKKIIFHGVSLGMTPAGARNARPYCWKVEFAADLRVGGSAAPPTGRAVGVLDVAIED